MITRTAAWIESEEDYKAFKRLMPDDADFPSSYEEWLKLRMEQIARHERAGRIIKKVPINPEGFLQYCERARISPSGYTFDAFAIATDCGYKIPIDRARKALES